MKIPFYCYPQKRASSIQLSEEDATIFHTDEGGKLHAVPRHLAEILDQLEVLEMTPEFSEEELETPESLKITYLDREGHIQRVSKRAFERSVARWVETVREAQGLATAARDCSAIKSRGQSQSNGPRRRLEQEAPK